MSPVWPAQAAASLTTKALADHREQRGPDSSGQEVCTGQNG